MIQNNIKQDYYAQHGLKQELRYTHNHSIGDITSKDLGLNSHLLYIPLVDKKEGGVKLTHLYLK